MAKGTAYVGLPLRPEWMYAYREASPVTYVSADDSPVLIIHADNDPLIAAEQAVMFEAALDCVLRRGIM